MPCHLSHRERQGGADVSIRPVIPTKAQPHGGIHAFSIDCAAMVMPRSFDALRLLRMTRVKRCCGEEIDAAVPSPSRLCRATSPTGRGKWGHQERQVGSSGEASGVTGRGKRDPIGRGNRGPIRKGLVTPHVATILQILFLFPRSPSESPHFVSIFILL